MTNFRLHQPGIVGAGRVAQALAPALRPHAIAPPMLWGRSPEKARSAAAAVAALLERILQRRFARCALRIMSVAHYDLAEVVIRMVDPWHSNDSTLAYTVQAASGGRERNP